MLYIYLMHSIQKLHFLKALIVCQVNLKKEQESNLGPV